MSVTGSSGGATTFLTFNSTSMLVNWFENLIRAAETFTVFLQGTITNLNSGSPFAINSQFILSVTPPPCQETQLTPIITAPNLLNQTYIWNSTAGLYSVPPFDVSSFLQICNVTNIVFNISITASANGSTTFINFNNATMVFDWYYSMINFSDIRVTETFTILISATIMNLNPFSPFKSTSTFYLDVTPPTCSITYDVPTITAPALSNQAYIWNSTAGSYSIPAFQVNSTFLFCNASDIVYTYTVSASAGGSTSFITFNATNLAFYWYYGLLHLAENFTITVTATITNQNTSPFVQTTSFLLVVKPTCPQSNDVLTIIPPTLMNQSYIWNTVAGSYIIPDFSVQSTLSICNASDIQYTMSVTASAGGDTKFITFQQNIMSVNWYSSLNLVAESFTITITATISTLNGAVTKSAQFNLDVTSAPQKDVLQFILEKIYYSIAPGDQIQIPVLLAQNGECLYNIIINQGSAESFSGYTLSSSNPQNGSSNISFALSPSVTQLDTKANIQITVQQIYNETSCQNPINQTQNFTVNVIHQKKNSTVAQKYNNTSVFIPPQMNFTSNNIKNNTSFIPKKYKKLEVWIESISVLAFVNVSYNQPLDVVFDMIIITYEQLSFEDPIQFNWTHVSNTTNNSQFQLKFSKPLSVSVGQQLDKVQIYLAAWEQSQTGFLKLTQHKLDSNIPMLVANAEELKTLTKISDTIGGSTKYMFWIFIICNILFSFAMGQLWGTFQTLQVIIAMPLLMAKIPPNVLQVFKGFSDIVNMKIIDSQLFYEYTIVKLSNAFDAWGQKPNSTVGLNQTLTNLTRRILQPDLRKINETKESQSPDQAAAITLNFKPESLTKDIIMCAVVLLFVLLAILIVVLCKSYIYPKAPKSIKNLILKIKGKLMWNGILRYMTQSYLDTAMKCMAGLLLFYDGTLATKILQPLTLLYVCVFPALVYLILKKNQENLHKEEIKNTIGSLYLNYETDKRSVLHFTMWFLYRRLIFAITFAYFKFSVVLQIYVVMQSSLVLLCFIFVWQPMESDIFDFLAIFNESILLVISYLLFLYTDYVPDPEMRYNFGNIFLYLLYINFAVNLVLLVVEIIRQMKREFMRCKSHRNQRKMRKLQKAILDLHYDRVLARAEQLRQRLEIENSIEAELDPVKKAQKVDAYHPQRMIYLKQDLEDELKDEPFDAEEESKRLKKIERIRKRRERMQEQLLILPDLENQAEQAQSNIVQRAEKIEVQRRRIDIHKFSKDQSLLDDYDAELAQKDLKIK